MKYILSVKAFSWFTVAVPPSIPPHRAWGLRARAPVPPCTLRHCLQYDYICTYCTSVRCTVNSLSTVCTEYSAHIYLSYIYYIVLFGQYSSVQCATVHIAHFRFWAYFPACGAVQWAWAELLRGQGRPWPT